MTELQEDRRRFKRIDFDAKTRLSQGSKTWHVQLLDLSLKGLLIERPSPWECDPGQSFAVDIQLSPDAMVKMDVNLTHVDASKNHLGFVCLHIGIESISHLRRLIELNLADPQELERELAALIEI
jgi:hypothetical protein